MREAGNLPASGYHDQLLVLKADLDSLKDNGGNRNLSESNGLAMLLAASGSVGEQSNNTAFGVGDAGAGAVLDDPFLQEFMQQPYGNWDTDQFDHDDPGTTATGQFQFDWENANLFGNL